jgi:hypothetical protein
VSTDEPVLVRCEEPRLYFALVVTARRIVFRREGMRGTDLMMCNLDGVSNARLQPVRPIGSWLGAVIALGVFALYVMITVRGGGAFDGFTLILPASAIYLVLASSTRWRLRFVSVGESYSILQPRTANLRARGAIARAIRDAHPLLADPEARAAAIARVRAEARVDEPEARGITGAVGEAAPAGAAEADPDERRLCPDGACVGLLDAAGRCKVCGRTA